MKTVFTTAARGDLADIGDYIARDNPTRAGTFTLELVAACQAIADLPFGAPVLPRYAKRGDRRKVHKIA